MGFPRMRALDASPLIRSKSTAGRLRSRANADTIYEQLASGSMPCYGPWPETNVQLFRDWMDGGFTQ